MTQSCSLEMDHMSSFLEPLNVSTKVTRAKKGTSEIFGHAILLGTESLIVACMAIHPLVASSQLVFMWTLIVSDPGAQWLDVAPSGKT